MKKKFLLGLLMGLFCSVHSQTVIVKDKRTNEALEMVTLASNEPNAYVTTNAEGEASISALKGAVLIEIRLLGYQTQRQSYADLKKSDFIVWMEQSQFNLDQVVVSATRWNQSNWDVPTKIESITPKEIALQNPQTAADLLAGSGEVYVQKSQLGGGSPMIRGFSTNRLLLVVDGVRMNNAIFRSGNLQNVISLDPFAMQSAEVLFGPGSVIYGSDAIGGVMSFQTLSPQFSLSDKKLVSGKAASRYSSANSEKTFHLDVNVGAKKWASLTSFSYTDFGDLRMGSNGSDEYLREFYVQRMDSMDVIIRNEDPEVQTPTGYSQNNLMQKIRFAPNESWDFEYAFHYSTTTDYPRYDRLIRMQDNQPRSAVWNYGPQKWLMNNLKVAFKSNNKLFDEVNLRLAHQVFGESRIDRDFKDTELRTRMEEVIAYSSNLDFRKSLGSTTQLYYGLEAVLNDVSSKGIDEDITTGIKNNGPSRYPQANWSSYASYLSLQHDLTENLKIQAGGRYNLFNLEADFSNNLAFYPFPEARSGIEDAALTGSMGLVYHPSPSWSISTHLSTGFRAPNVDDMGKVFDSEPGAIVVPNTSLSAEYAYNAEVGIAKIIGNSIKLDLTTYYTLLENAMVRRDFVLNGRDSIRYEGEMSKVQAIQNAAQARVYGIQAGFEVKLLSDLDLSANFSYQKGKEELDNGNTSPSRHAAPAFGHSRLTYDNGDLQLQLYVVYTTEKSFDEMPEDEKGKSYMYATDANGNPYAPEWYTLNFKAMKRINENFSLSAGIENITDQRYRPYSSGIVAPGRNLIFSLRADF